MSMSFEPGAPAKEGSIPLSVPVMAGNEWQYVKECLDSGWVSSVGGFVDRFERMIIDYVGIRHAVAVVNGTGALHMALLLVGVEPDDEVLIPTLTFIASANAIRYAGAWPVFMDVEPNHWQLDVNKTREFLQNECEIRDEATYNKATGRRIRAILPVHVLGHPVDMDAVLEIAEEYHLKVVEDAAESLGSLYKGQHMGTFGDTAALSFNGNKIITTGGGGMVITKNDRFAARARYLTTQAKDDPLEYIHGETGYNYRLTNLQAAVGCAQMELLPDYVNKKREIAARYNAAFADHPGLIPQQEAEWAESNMWLYTIRIDAVQYGLNSRALLRKLASQNIQSRPLWQPMHLSKAFAMLPPRACPVAEKLHKECLSLPCSVNLSMKDQQTVINLILEGASC
jgi:perosamine synthetase